MLEKRIIEEVLTEQHQELLALSSVKLCSRKEESLIDLESSMAQCVIGVRRSGKSTLCYNMLHSQKVKFAYVNFDEAGNIVGFTIPQGQIVPYSSSYDFWLVGNKAGTGSYYPNAPLTWKFEKGTFTFDGDEPDSMGILAVSHSDNSSIAGWWNKYDVPPMYVKK